MSQSAFRLAIVVLAVGVGFVASGAAAGDADAAAARRQALSRLRALPLVLPPAPPVNARPAFTRPPVGGERRFAPPGRPLALPTVAPTRLPTAPSLKPELALQRRAGEPLDPLPTTVPTVLVVTFLRPRPALPTELSATWDPPASPPLVSVGVTSTGIRACPVDQPDLLLKSELALQRQAGEPLVSLPATVPTLLVVPFLVPRPVLPTGLTVTWDPPASPPLVSVGVTFTGIRSDPVGELALVLRGPLPEVSLPLVVRPGADLRQPLVGATLAEAPPAPETVVVPVLVPVPRWRDQPQLAGYASLTTVESAGASAAKPAASLAAVVCPAPPAQRPSPRGPWPLRSPRLTMPREDVTDLEESIRTSALALAESKGVKVEAELLPALLWVCLHATDEESVRTTFDLLVSRAVGGGPAEQLMAVREWSRTYREGRHAKDVDYLAAAFLYRQRLYPAAEQQIAHCRQQYHERQDYLELIQALCDLRQGRHDAGRERLMALLGTYPDSPHAAQAKFLLAWSYLVNQRFAEAATYLRDVIKNHPASDHAKQAQELLQGLPEGGDKE